MPGLVGFSGMSPGGDSNKMLTAMLGALDPACRFQIDRYHNLSTGMGRVTLGIVNAYPQPAWNQDRTVCLFLEGEIFNYQEDAKKLLVDGRSFDISNQADYLLNRYELYGSDFAKGLNGSFAVAIWDERFQKLLLVTDRLCTYPLYYAIVEGRLLFASGVRALLADPALSRETDFIGIAQFLTFDHLLNDRTLLKTVKLLQQA